MAAGKKATLYSEIIDEALSQEVAKNMRLSYCQKGSWAFSAEVGPHLFLNTS